MPKMQVNEDGTITFPLRGREPVTLDEPSMEDLAWLTEEAERVDDALPVLPAVTDTNDRAQLDAYTKAARDRTTATYGGDTPYGKVVIEAIARMALTSDPTERVAVDPTQLYGWAASPLVIRTMLEHFRAPLPGPASLPN